VCVTVRDVFSDLWYAGYGSDASGKRMLWDSGLAMGFC